jgi:hypothetical protein
MNRTLPPGDRGHRSGDSGRPHLEGLCLALSDWSAELRIVQNEQRRRAGTQRRDVSGGALDHTLTE